MSLLSEALGASPGGPGGQTQGRGHEPLAQVASGPHPHPHLSPQESPAQDAQQPRPASSSGGRAPGLDQAQSRVRGLSPWPEDLLPQKQAWNSHDTPGHRRFLGTRPGAVSPPPRAPHPAPQLPAPPQLLGFPAGWGVLGRPPAHPHRTLGIPTTGPCRRSCAHLWTAWGSGGRAVSARALWDPREAPGRPHACSGGTGCSPPPRAQGTDAGLPAPGVGRASAPAAPGRCAPRPQDRTARQTPRSLPPCPLGPATMPLPPSDPGPGTRRGQRAQPKARGREGGWVSRSHLQWTWLWRLPGRAPPRGVAPCRRRGSRPPGARGGAAGLQLASRTPRSLSSAWREV